MLNSLRWASAPLLLTIALVGIAAGALVAFVNPLIGFAALVGLLGASVLARDAQWGLYGVMAIATLLPFAAIPLNIGFNPTFLDIVTLLLVAVWLVQVATGRRAGWHTTALDLPVLLFLALALTAFILGLGAAGVSVATLRRFVEILMAIGAYFVVANVLRARPDLERAAKVLLALGFAASLIGIILYVIPDALANQLLNTLRVVRYPTGNVLRYIEDDPSLPKRAIATAVDPNVLGGLLILMISLAIPQWFSPRRLFRRELIVAIVAATGLCLLLTFSRGSLLGAGVAVGFILFALLSRRMPPLVAAVITGGSIVLGAALVFGLLWVLPWTQSYATHLVEGILGQDRATQMRFGEYKDALNLIARYPWFGVGFTGVPDVDLYVGVSSLYLLMASRMGLIGLASFAIVIVVFFTNRWVVFKRAAEIDPILLGALAAVLGALVGGIFDHYFFNLDFPHSVTLFWLFVGMAMSAHSADGNDV
ncbi:MAG: O-antigen ligase family protein [Chloroflexi bacterium]|nr:O-antigen ligase family protein [Chloroflexota bacterium]